MISYGIDPGLLTVSQINTWVGTIDEHRYRKEMSLVGIYSDLSGEL
jgi:hypothetical protein